MADFQTFKNSLTQEQKEVFKRWYDNLVLKEQKLTKETFLAYILANQERFLVAANQSIQDKKNLDARWANDSN